MPNSIQMAQNAYSSVLDSDKNTDANKFASRYEQKTPIREDYEIE